MLDGGLVAFAGPARGLLPASAEAVQQAANMIPIVTDSEATPNQIGDTLRGPDGRGESISFGSSCQQPWERGQLSARQLGRPSGVRATMQGFLTLPSSSLCPNEHRLTAYAELSGNRGQRFPALKSGDSGQPPLFHRLRISSGTYGNLSHDLTIPQIMAVSTYLYIGL